MDDSSREGNMADVSTMGVRERASEQQRARIIPALTLVSHSMAHRVGERLLLEPLTLGREVALSRNLPDFQRPGSSLGLPLADPFLSRKPLVFSPAPEEGLRLNPGEGSKVSIGGMLLSGPWEFTREEVAAGIPLELAGRVVLLLHLADLSLTETADTLGMVGVGGGVQRVRRHIEQVADLNVPVLVRGETGSGKELIARAIHQRSKRRDKAFISVNLGAIPKELAAAELFGAHKGAYTGSTRDREGFFRAAHEGTLFLDEVGEAPPEVQVMLLRVLETGEIYPVGGHTPVATDVRLIAATDAQLEDRIQDGRFKAPLLHRLSGYDLRVPALRERREDIGLLFHHFAREVLEELGETWRLKPEDASAEPWLPASLASRLVQYAWPGNIRQLRNLSRQLIIGSRGHPHLRLDPRLEQELEAETLARPGRPAVLSPTPEPKTPARRKASDVAEEELLSALRECAWDLKATADRLGIPRSSIYDLIDKSPHLRTAGDLSVEELTRCYRECGGDLEAMARRLEVSKRALGRRIKELGLASQDT
ncbi:sigma 54-interacting transcriptional regulator [Stigmatella sp. ncwal1]|uniref:Sigma 54-interacting transcriptional regulator n=1 Tax=Stigmatella ashevillensis TaxID=2995309 RepID=A0ABT5DIL2_9BACT|nr:sigma 54-interacting transcriptional regulator [Stigmatella ashevillena]MDC0712157.1 sigma 54-interacting transcriptional regulator [Stigmatella ashevillena]